MSNTFHWVYPTLTKEQLPKNPRNAYRRVRRKKRFAARISRKANRE